MERMILGFFNKPPKEGSWLAFVKVIGEFVDNKITIGSSYNNKYPSEGEVAFANPPDSIEATTIGLFKVEESESVNRNLTVYSEYRVASKDWIQPIELIRVNKVVYPKDVRELLIKGLSLPFKPSKQACLVLDDGVVIKIPEITASDESSRLYRVRASLLKGPLECWSGVNVFEPVTINFDLYKRMLSSSINWPKNDGFFDCATDSEIVAFTFNKLSELFKEDIGITKAQRREIINSLERYEDELIGERIRRTIQILQMAESKESIFEVNLNDILNTQPVIKEKEEYIKESVKAALNEMRSQKQDLFRELDELKRDREKLEEAISVLEKSREQLLLQNERNAKFGEEIVNRIQLQVNEAADNAAELIANISIIRPFLCTNGEKKDIDSYLEFKPIDIKGSDPKGQYNDCDQLINLLAENIKSLGMSMSSAKKVARFLVAIKLAKLTPLTIHADSRDFALATSAAFTGRTPLIIPPNFFATNGLELDSFIFKNINDYPTVILFEDINSFANEAKLLSILRDVKYIEKLGMVGLSINEARSLFNATIMLSSDSSLVALPMMPALWEHAIAVNYGAFINKYLESRTIELKTGIVAFNDWYRWPLTFNTSNGLEDFLDGISKKGVTLSCAMKKNIHALYTCLINIGSEEKEALELIIINHLLVIAKGFGWIEQLIEFINEENIINDIKGMENGIVWLGEKN